jgi:PGF-CTERM protein
MIKKSPLIILIILLLTIFISGCVNSRTASIDTDVTVNKSGYITKYKTTISMPENTYHDFVKNLQNQKYSSVREFFLRDYGGSNTFFTTTENIGSTTTIVLTNVIPVPRDKLPKSILINIKDNQIFYNDSSYSNNYFFDENLVARMDYSVTFPVKIDRGNYHKPSRDGYTAIWEYKNDQNTWFVNNPIDIPTLYAITQVATQENYKPEETPGFGALITLFGIFACVFLISRQK